MEQQLYRVRKINSESDLPKKEGKYIVEFKSGDMSKFTFLLQPHSNLYWRKNISRWFEPLKIEPKPQYPSKENGYNRGVGKGSYEFFNQDSYPDNNENNSHIDIEKLKKQADKVATYFGYNINSLSLDVINVKDAYCMGHMDGSKDPLAHPLDRDEFFDWLIEEELKAREEMLRLDNTPFKSQSRIMKQRFWDFNEVAEKYKQYFKK